jgi:endonuclease YncB( thermonuclease family)
MRRKYLLIVVSGICVAGLAVALFLVFHHPSSLSFVNEIPTVHDGDTIYYQQHSFCRPTRGVRLLGIATPELDEAGGEDAQEAFQALVNECGGRLWIDAPSEVQNDPYCRLIAILLVHRHDKVSVNEQLVADGWAHICKMQGYSDQLKNFEQRLLKAQIEAAINRRGRWAEGGDVVIAAIQYWTDPEQVVLVNRGEESVSVEDWYLLNPEPERSGLFRLEDVLDMSIIPPRTAVSFKTKKQWDNEGDSAELYDHDPHEGGEPLDVYEYKKFH